MAKLIKISKGVFRGYILNFFNRCGDIGMLKIKGMTSKNYPKDIFRLKNQEG